MVHLLWAANDFGITTSDTVKAIYNTYEEALAQAEHDLALGRHPLKIVDLSGLIRWTAPQG